MKTFRNLSKYKQHCNSNSIPNNNNNNLICPNCYNIEIINEKANYNNKHSSSNNDNNIFEDKHKLTHLQNINNKISLRDKHSQNTYKQLSLFTLNTPKEQLQHNFENSTKHNFFSTNKDYSRDRALTHHSQHERYINTYKNNFTFQTENPNVLTYYEHYVDNNYKTEPNKRISCYDRSNYYQELQKQIENKMNSDKERKRKEIEENKKILQQQRDMFSERDMKEQKERMRMQKEFNDYNKKIVEDKKIKRMKRKEECKGCCYVDGKERKELMGKCAKCNKVVPSNVLSVSLRKYKLNEKNKLKY